MLTIDKLKTKAMSIKSDIQILYYTYRDKRVGILAKIIVLITIAYALSPIDIIPDFIPILGYLDDLIIIPLLIIISLRLIPSNVWEECIKKAEENPIKLRKNWFVGIIIILIWVFIVIMVIKYILTLIKFIK